MKPYGVPRNKSFDWNEPDTDDLSVYGLKSSRGYFPGRNGKDISIPPNFRNSKIKGRRIWKKRYRSIIKRKLKECYDF